MKQLLIILILFCSCGFISCGYVPEKSFIISGKDTVEIIGHYSWRHLGSPCGGEGSYDTLTKIFTWRFNQCDYGENARLLFLVDSLIKSSKKESDSFTVHFTTRKPKRYVFKPSVLITPKDTLGIVEIPLGFTDTLIIRDTIYQ